MFSSRVPLAALIEHCRATRHMLDAGLTLPRVMVQQAEKGPTAIRPVASRMAEELAKGTDFHTALEDEEKHFPRLYIDLVAVGEDTGRLTDVLGELEDFYTLQQKLKRDFISQLIWPMIQLVLAIGILSGLIFLRALIPALVDFTGMGLKGPSGVVQFLGGWVVFFGVLAGMYYFASYVLKKKGVIDGLLLKLPVIGKCIEAWVMSRFCLGLYMTLEAGMPIRRAIRLSLQGTGNGAFAACSGGVEARIQKGKDLTVALKKAGVFPDEFLLILETAEESGQIPLIMRKQAQRYAEEAGRRLKILAVIFSRSIYLLVALFVIVMIFKLYGGVMGQRDAIMRDFKI